MSKKPRGVASPTSPQRITNMEKLSQALRLRRGGATFQQIADQGIYSSAQAAQRAVLNYYGKVHREITQDLDAIRQEEVDRLDALLRSLWPIAVKPSADRHLYAVDRVVKLMQHRARLLGLEMPEQHEVTGQGGERLIPPGIDLSNLDAEQLEQVRGILEMAADDRGSPTA